MGQINIPPEPTLLHEGLATVLFLIMLLGPIIAFACLFKKDISTFLKRISMTALVFMLPFTMYLLWMYAVPGKHPALGRTEKILMISCGLSLLSWLYIQFGKKVRNVSEEEFLINSGTKDSTDIRSNSVAEMNELVAAVISKFSYLKAPVETQFIQPDVFRGGFILRFEKCLSIQYLDWELQIKSNGKELFGESNKKDFSGNTFSPQNLHKCLDRIAEHVRQQLFPE